MSDARRAAEQPSLPGPTLNAGRRNLYIDIAWFLLLAIWSAVWCLSAAQRLGPTYDEPLHLGAGIENWRFGTPERISIQGNMTLPIKSVTLPLYLREKWTGQPFRNVDELLTYLPQARAMMLGWFWLLLIATMRLGQVIGGPWAGRIAAGLIAVDPNFLAHATLATTDIPLPAALMAFTLVAYTGRNGNGWQRIVLPGIWFGIAVLTKLSALLYGGVILVGLEAAHRATSGSLTRPAGATFAIWGRHIAVAAVRSTLAIAAVIVIGCVLTIIVSGWSPPGSKPMALALQQMSPDDPLRPRYEKLAEYERLPYAGVAFAFQWWHNSHGSPAFLNGVHYPEGCWFYFPVLLAMKLPLPVLLLGLIALGRPRAVFHPLTLVALLLFLVTLAAKRQTGIRLVLPVVAIGYVAVAVAVCRAYERSGVWLGSIAVIVTAAISVFVWPNGLGYLNQAFGGPPAARYRVSDSNLDWGQGVPELLKWHKKHGEPPMSVWYFGTDTAAAKPPFTQLFIERSPVSTEEEFKSVVGPRLLAVGETVLSLHPFDPPQKAAAMRYLLKLKPVAYTSTFAIYDFRGDLPPASP